MTLLERIDDPADLRKLSVEELRQVAAEIRDYIADVVFERGGHFGSSAGAVELTLALHRVFETPRDKIIWDVGHQTYPHKIITGRREWFRTLRSFKGISGFLKRTESEYDVFGAGHASTSISAAVGFAVARDRAGTDEKVIAVIGDGAMTGGLAYEALNHAGALQTDLLVILNDNAMSIAGNVGALSHYLNRLLTMPLYHKVKDDIEDLVSHLNERTLLDRRFPGLARLGNVILEKAMRLKEGVKNMVLPSLLFEELGFTYYGPVDGNDLDQLLPMLDGVKAIRRPVLLHVITSKGKGFGWSENHPEKGHAARPGFDVKTGTMTVEVKRTPPSWTEVFADELIALAEKDPSIVAITAAMPSGTGIDRFQARFPERTFDVGIAEGHAVVFAAGLAAAGMKPVVAIYSSFMQRAFDMIIHDVCTQNLPVFFALDRGGIVGDDGETHQGVYDLGYLRMIPRLNVMAPKNDRELREMMRLGLASNLPAAVRYPRGIAPVADGNDAPVAWGKAETLREGSDLHVLAFGSFAVEALAAAAAVEQETGRSIGVVNLRWVKPLDLETVLAAARRSGRIVTYEENALMTGGGAAVLEAIADAGVTAAVRRLGVPDRFVEHGEQMEARRAIGLAPGDLRRTIKEMLGS